MTHNFFHICFYLYVSMLILNHRVTSRISSKQLLRFVFQPPQAVLLAIWQHASTLGLETAPGRDLPVLLWSLVPWLRVRIGGIS